jgi:hypothetical protein
MTSTTAKAMTPIETMIGRFLPLGAVAFVVREPLPG